MSTSSRKYPAFLINEKYLRKINDVLWLIKINIGLYNMEIGNSILTRRSDFCSITRYLAKQISLGHIQDPRNPQVTVKH